MTKKTPGQRSKIALYGLFGWGSLGDLALQESVIAYLRCYRPDVDVYLVCPNPEDATERFGLPAYPIGRMPSKPWPGQQWRPLSLVYRVGLRVPIEAGLWLQPGRRLRGFEKLVISGGGQLEDYGVSALRYPYDMYKWQKAAQVDRVEFVVLSVGAGPLREPMSRWFVAHMLKHAAYRSYRDQGSRDYLVGMGLPYANDPVVPDLAFGLPIPDDVAALAAKRTDAQPTVVGVTGMSYYDPRGWPMQDQARYDLYVQRLTNLTARLIRNGYGVRMLVGDVWCDRRTVDDIVAALGAEGVQPAPGQLVAEPIYTVTELLREIAQVDIVVSSRLHPIIFGLLLDKPAVSVAYNQKNDSVMRSVGLDAFRHQIDDFDPDLLYQDVLRIEAQAPALRSQIHQVVARFRGEVFEQNLRVFGDTRGEN